MGNGCRGLHNFQGERRSYMQFFEKTVKQSVIYNGKILNVHVDEVELCDGRRAKREVCDHPGGVGILPLDGQGNVLLVRQFRYPYGEELLEIPAGKLEPGEDPYECGVRELREETGCSADEIVPLGVVYPSPGYVNEKLYLYLAKGLHAGKACPDEDEFLSVEKIKFDELLSMIDQDRIHDAKTVTAALKAARIIKR